MLISSIDYNEYVGRIGIGRIARGTIQVNQQVMIGNYHDPETASRNKVVSLLQIQGLQKSSGRICNRRRYCLDQRHFQYFHRRYRLCSGLL